jgi:hypothetical protein
MPDMNELDTIISRLLWSEIKDADEFRSYLDRAGYKIVPLNPTPAMCEAGWAQVTRRLERGCNDEMQNLIKAVIEAA